MLLLYIIGISQLTYTNRRRSSTFSSLVATLTAAKSVCAEVS